MLYEVITADGYMMIKENIEGYEKDEFVEVYLF